jgi:hypothetical protein
MQLKLSLLWDITKSSLCGFDWVLMAFEGHNVGARDLRLKLQKKTLHQASQSGSLSGVRDLREKLSGLINTQPMNIEPSKPKLEALRPARKSIVVEAATDVKKATNSAPRKKASQKACPFSFYFNLSTHYRTSGKIIVLSYFLCIFW